MLLWNILSEIVLSLTDASDTSASTWVEGGVPAPVLATSGHCMHLTIPFRQSLGLQETYVGSQAQALRGILALSSPWRQGAVQDWDDLEAVWDHCYNRYWYHLLKSTLWGSPIGNRPFPLQIHIIATLLCSLYNAITFEPIMPF